MTGALDEPRVGGVPDRRLAAKLVEFDVVEEVFGEIREDVGALLVWALPVGIDGGDKEYQATPPRTTITSKTTARLRIIKRLWLVPA